MLRPTRDHNLLLQKSVQRLRGFYENRPALFTALIAVLLAFAAEALNRHSLFAGAAFFFLHPVHFLTNASIIMGILSIGLLFRRRAFFLTLFAAAWMILAAANAVLLCFRTTPLGVMDIVMLPSVFSIIGVYLKLWQILLILLAILAVAAGLVFVFVKCPKSAPQYRRVLSFALICAVFSVSLYHCTIWGKEEEREDVFSNIRDAYLFYGFPYCFCTSILDRGIDEPDFYSRKAVRRLMKRLEEPSAPDVRPDIIMVQLESFFDVSYLDDVEYAKDPIPVFRRLKETYTSGFLTVPSVGAGTANTEFEILSGMSLDFFGMGEYPYMTTLQEKACETIAADLRPLGYLSHAIHNNTATFYDRNNVFAQLGFDTFTSLEFMHGVTYNPIGWARDAVLTKEIEKALNTSDDPHFVFTITVQGHGKYQQGVENENIESTDVTWEDDPEEEEDLAYYLDQLSETDAFIGELVSLLEKRAKPAVLVLYGDHLPNFDIGSDQLENGDIFQTEYVIWDNLNLPVEHPDLDAYQLSAYVLEKLGIGSGILTRYHQQLSESSDYEDGLMLLEYDMLYGKNYCCRGGKPYTSSDLQMGTAPLRVAGAAWEDGILTVSGEEFTDWSRVTIDEKEQDTMACDANTLQVALPEPPQKGALITVRQCAPNTAILAESNPYRY